MIYGKVGRDSIEQLIALVPEFTLKDNIAELCFYDGERAFMQIGAAKEVEVTLNGQTFSGEIVLARVSADGKQALTINRQAQS